MKLLLLLAFAAASSCEGRTPVPPPRPARDAGPVQVIDGGDIFEDACANLKQLECPEGNKPSCADRMRKAEETHLTKTNASCVAGAATKQSVRNCGAFVRCAEGAPSTSPTAANACADSLCGLDSYCSCHEVGGKRCWSTAEDCAIDRACCAERGDCAGMVQDACTAKTKQSRK